MITTLSSKVSKVTLIPIFLYISIAVLQRDNLCIIYFYMCIHIMYMWHCILCMYVYTQAEREKEAQPILCFVEHYVSDFTCGYAKHEHTVYIDG